MASQSPTSDSSQQDMPKQTAEEMLMILEYRPLWCSQRNQLPQNIVIQFDSRELTTFLSHDVNLFQQLRFLAFMEVPISLQINDLSNSKTKGRIKKLVTDPSQEISLVQLDLMEYSSCTAEYQTNTLVFNALTLRILATGHNLLGTKNWCLGIVGQDANSCLQHAHRSKGIAAAT